MTRGLKTFPDISKLQKCCGACEQLDALSWCRAIKRGGSDLPQATGDMKGRFEIRSQVSSVPPLCPPRQIRHLLESFFEYMNLGLISFISIYLLSFPAPQRRVPYSRAVCAKTTLFSPTRSGQ